MRIAPTRTFLLAIVLCAAGFVGWSSYETRQLEHRLGGIASEIAGRHVRVHCQSSFGAAIDVTGEAGSVYFDANGRPANVTDLKRDICVRLDRYRHEHSSARFACTLRGTHCSLDAIKSLHALHTLAHESWHLHGVRSEAVTECYAIQTTALVARRLGASPEEAHAAARTVAGQIYPQMPSDYQTSDCHDGGPLDLRPRSQVWP
jgi:hypothetical protein